MRQTREEITKKKNEKKKNNRESGIKSIFHISQNAIRISLMNIEMICGMALPRINALSARTESRKHSSAVFEMMGITRREKNAHVCVCV